MRRGILSCALIGGFVLGLATGAIGGEGGAEAPYPPGCKPPMGTLSAAVIEGASGEEYPLDALPPDIADDVSSPTGSSEGGLTYQTQEGELYHVEDLGNGYVLTHILVCGGEFG